MAYFPSTCMGLRITEKNVDGIPSVFFPLDFWIDIMVWLFILLRSLFSWDVVHHWVIDDLCFDTLCFLRTSGTIYTVTWHHIPEEWKHQLYHHKSVKNLHICCVACCGDLPNCVILPVNGRQVLKILVTTVAVIQKVTFPWTC